MFLISVCFCPNTRERPGANGFTRGSEHAAGLRSNDLESALWKHCILEHESEEAKFSMKVLDTFQSSMARQVNEEVRIKRSKAQT